jgi:type II secretory pathway pseudopilin PulG
MNQQGQAGLTLIETMVAIAIAAGVLLGIIVVFHNFVNVATKSAAQQHTSVTLAQFMDKLEADANSSIAIFVPATDVNGVSNVNGHEVDFYTIDGSKNPHFWAYNFSSATHSIQKYTYAMSPASVPTSVVAVGTPIVLSTGNSKVGAFSATLETAASRASDPMFASYTPVNHQLATGFTGVTAGNDLVAISVTAQADTKTGSETRSTRLMAGTQLSGAKYVVGTFTPNPNPLSVSVNPINFGSQLAAPATTVALENYYVGNFTYSDGTCTPSIVTIAQSGSNGNTFTVSPNTGITSNQSCTFIVSDQLGQSVNVPVSLTYAAQPLVVNPTTMTFTSVSAAAQSFNVSETDYVDAFTISPGSTCLTSSEASISAMSANGPSTSFKVTPVVSSGGGTCTFTVSDNHGSSQQVSVTIYGPLTVNPTSLLFTSPTAAAQNVAISELAYPGTFTIGSSTCGGYAALSGTSFNGPAASLTVTPTSVTPLGCSFVVNDDHGDSKTVTVQVEAEPYTPPPSATPPPPTPSATPCTFDSHGYCGVQTAGGPFPKGSVVRCDIAGVPHVELEYTVSGYLADWSVYSATNSWTFTDTWSFAPSPCHDGQYIAAIGPVWAPQNPASEFGDPNLP